MLLVKIEDIAAHPRVVSILNRTYLRRSCLIHCDFIVVKQKLGDFYIKQQIG